MFRIFKYFVALLLLGGAVGLWLTRPQSIDSEKVENLKGDVARGEHVFNAAGCKSCHKSTVPGSDATLLVGGMAFPSEFGTFYAPNISADPDFGIGSWTLVEFANAVTKGVSPDGKHYYPAFPYTSYNKMRDQDVVDLWAFMQTVPADPTPSQAHDVGFPFNIRRSLGGWKLLFETTDWVVTSPANERGRYLVEALGHCGECHTPRNALGGSDLSNWLAGAPDPSGRGRIPAITPDQLQWSVEDIAYYLETGFTPEFDSAGGHMADVIDNMSKLPPEDREAIAEYLVGLN